MKCAVLSCKKNALEKQGEQHFCFFHAGLWEVSTERARVRAGTAPAVSMKADFATRAEKEGL